MKGKLIAVRGSGDLATGVIVRLVKAGYSVVALDIEKPTSIRRTVALSEALYDGEAVVEGVKARKAASVSHALRLLEESFRCGERIVPVLIDPNGKTIEKFAPDAVVDAIIAKRNLGTRIDMAPFVVALGPGFTVGVDCHAIVETKRGHYLGSVIYEGSAIPNTGIPGIIGGVGTERVQRAPAMGIFFSDKKIGEIVAAGDLLGYVKSPDGSEVPMVATIDGCLRGLLRSGLEVTPGYKCGDIDPRADASFCFSISDKARAVAGGVLEALDGFFAENTGFGRPASDR